MGMVKAHSTPPTTVGGLQNKRPRPEDGGVRDEEDVGPEEDVVADDVALVDPAEELGKGCALDANGRDEPLVALVAVLVVDVTADVDEVNATALEDEVTAWDADELPAADDTITCEVPEPAALLEVTPEDAGGPEDGGLEVEPGVLVPDAVDAEPALLPTALEDRDTAPEDEPPVTSWTHAALTQRCPWPQSALAVHAGRHTASAHTESGAQSALTLQGAWGGTMQAKTAAATAIQAKATRVWGDGRKVMRSARYLVCTGTATQDAQRVTGRGRDCYTRRCQMRFLSTLLLGVLLLVAPALHAHPDVVAARKLYSKGEFAKALNALERGERSLTRTDDDTVEILWLKGSILHAMTRGRQADEAFDALIAVRPLHEPERWEASPDLRARFEARVTAYKKEKAVLLGEPGLDGFTLLVPVERYPERIHALTAYVRASGEASFNPLTLQLRADLAEVDLRDEALWRQAAQVGALELVVEAVNPRGVPHCPPGQRHRTAPAGGHRGRSRPGHCSLASRSRASCAHSPGSDGDGPRRRASSAPGIPTARRGGCQGRP